MNTEALQTKLASEGFYKGDIDGAHGRMTIAAIKAFQLAHGLQGTGAVGPKTTALLFPDADRGAIMLPPWYSEATRLMGLKEGKGSADNKVILDWADDLDLNYPHDSIAWCGLFAGHCIEQTLPEEPLPANPLGARNYLKLGVECEPQIGAVLVFWREKKTGWLGHVGFCAGDRKDAYRVRGGNQGDSVSDAWVAKNRLLGARWPATALRLQTGKMVAVAGAGGLSKNEA